VLSHLDRIVFADRCEVIEVIPSQRYVYPIFKNGYSSFIMAKEQNNWRVYINQQIQKIINIDVIIRNPQDRVISGINTFTQNVMRDNSELDATTVRWFAQNYLHLDRHYCPQFSWILNLARYLNADAKLNFLSMSNIDDIAKLHKKPPGICKVSEDLAEQFAQIKNNEMYQRIDTIIFNAIGQSMTFGQLLQFIKHNDTLAYEYVIGHAQQILAPTYVLP